MLARLALAFALLLSACVVYEPVPVQSRNVYEESWNAALGAAHESGVRVTTADRGSGIIRGVKASMDVTLLVRTLPDNRVQVEINAKGSPNEEGLLTRQITESYNRRMGR
jgi:hypothetical protein